MVDQAVRPTVLSKPADEAVAPSTVSRQLDPEIDYTDPEAVRELLCRLHPFGDIISLEGIAEACRSGRGRAIVEMLTPSHLPQPDAIPLSEMIDPPVNWIMSIEDVERRAFVILNTGFYGVDEDHKAAIRSVAEAGIVGWLAQTNLQVPEKPKRRWR